MHTQYYGFAANRVVVSQRSRNSSQVSGDRTGGVISSDIDRSIIVMDNETVPTYSTLVGV